MSKEPQPFPSSTGAPVRPEPPSSSGETPEELALVTGLDMTAGQGYLLGQPTTRPRTGKNGALLHKAPRP